MDALGATGHGGRSGGRSSLHLPRVEGRSSIDAPRVLVVGAHLMTAETVALALNHLAPTTRFVAPVTIAHLEELVDWRPKAALLDIESIDVSTAVKAIATLRAAGAAVVVMSGAHDALTVGQCLTAGASLVVNKDTPFRRITEIIDRELAHDASFGHASRCHSRAPTSDLQPVVRSRRDIFDVLTPREQYVLAQLMEGHSADSIAARSSVAGSIVRSQIKAILQKLGVNSQLAAAGLARKGGWTFEPVGATARRRSSSATTEAPT